MARKRQIDPDIWTSEQFIALSIEARLMFIGMISHADDEGRLKGSTLSLKVSIFPADEYSSEQIKQWRDEIVQKQLVQHYEIDVSEYLYLPTFRKYQYMTKTFPSKLPPPPSRGEVNNKLITGEQHLYGIGNGNGIGIEVGTNNTTKNLSISQNFDIFWKAYPKRKSKGQAEKAFEKVNPDGQLLATILAAIEVAKKSVDWQKNDGQFIPYPATWLSARGWEDEVKKGGESGQSTGVRPLGANRGRAEARRLPGHYRTPEEIFGDSDG